MIVKIIDRRTVELETLDERRANVMHRLLLDDGISTLAAAQRVEERYPALDPAFYRWLRDEPLMPEIKLPWERDSWSEWHSETWAEVVNVLRDHMTELGFEVHVNPNMGQLTIRANGKALTVMNVTGSHFNEDGALVIPRR